ncbi:MAG: DEAD/DEAH box helicase, partial [Desulfovibrionaceae bacterium]
MSFDEETAYCDCPWFLLGNPCKHLWAAVLAADAELAALNPHLEPAPGVAPEPDWKSLLFPGQARQDQGPNRWEGVPGQFMLRYDLDVDRGQIRLTTFKHKVLKSGKPGKQTAVVTENILDEPDLPRMDRAILQSMQSIADRTAHSYSRWYNPYRRRRLEGLPLGSTDLSQILPGLAVTGRCNVMIDGATVASPLVKGEPFAAGLEMQLDEESASNKRKRSLVYEPCARLGERLVPFTDIPTFFGSDPMLFIHEGRLHEMPEADFEWLVRVRKAGNLIKVPKQDAKELVLALDAAEAPPSLDIPEDVAPACIDDAAPTPGLEIELESDGLTGRVWLDYGGLEVPLDDPRESILNVENWTRIRRSSETEAAHLKQLADLGLDASDGRFAAPADAGFKALDALAAGGWRLWGRDRRPVQPGAVSGLRVSSGVDWFDLEGDVAFGDAIVPLPRVVRAYLRGEKAIDLGEGRTGLLPLEWLEKNAPGLGLGAGPAKDRALRFHSAHAMLLDELLEECGEQHMDQDFARLRRCLRDFQGVTPPQPPRSFQGELRGYQREALGWFDFLKTFGFGGVLADDMGLGKTVQALAWLALEKQRNGDGSRAPALVVAPTSLVPNWQDEAAKFAPGLKVLAYTGLDRKQHAESLADYDLVLTTYGLLRRDVETLRDVQWSWAILDESQAVKNPDSQTAKAARLLQTQRRLCMTGTPLENRLDELWSQMQFLNPGLLGSRAGFDKRFAKPVAQGDESAREMLKRCIRPFVLRRTKDVVAADLPEKQEFVLRCDMPPD